MGIETITRAAKQFYEELYLQQTERQLFYTLFNMLDESTAAGFMIDKLTGSPYAVTYRAKNGESHVRQYAPGSGLLIEPPIASEKTPLSEELLDRVVAGVDASSGFGNNEAALINQIVREHVAAMNMTKNKQALDVLKTGTFPANGPGGVDIEEGIDLSRAGANSLTYDFTVGSATMTIALSEAVEQLRSKGTPLDNMVCVMGSDWITKYNSDTAIAGYMDNNSANQIVASQMAPSELLNTEGLYVMGQYRGPGMVAPLWICQYAPPTSYVKDLGAASEPYVSDNAAIFFSLSDVRYRVNRGVNVIGENGKRMREVGDLVIDRFADNDPVTEYVRSNTRHCFVPANIDHTAVSVGTFS